MRVKAKRYFLHMTDRTQGHPVPHQPAQTALRRSRIPCPEFSRFLYTAVGGDWFWIDKLGWSYQQWMDMVSAPGFQTWVLYVQETPAGYFELKQTTQGVEIASFGLLRSFQKQGLGGWLLSQAIDAAWNMQPHRIWLHTCELDHPHALDNYLKRGFVIFESGMCLYDLPDQTIGPWAGCMLPSHPHQRFA